MDGYSGFFYPLHATAIFLDSFARPLHLTLAGLATQLGDQLIELANTGRAQGVPLGFKATGRIDRDASAQGKFAALCRRTATTKGHKPQIFRL